MLDNDLPEDVLNNTIELRKPRTCIVCDKTFYDKRKTCSDECLQKYKIQSRKELPVTKDELQDLVSTKSMLQIGKQFGVSDNAIRKWCKKYGIESKRKFECTKEELQTLIESGLSRRAISKKVGVGSERIQRMIDHYNLSIESKCVRYSDEIVDQVLDYITKGLTNIEIAKLMDMDHKQISAIRCKEKKKTIKTH